MSTGGRQRHTWFFLPGFDDLSQVQAVITLNHLLAASEPASWLKLSVNVSRTLLVGGACTRVCVVPGRTSGPLPPPWLNRKLEDLQNL